LAAVKLLESAIGPFLLAVDVLGPSAESFGPTPLTAAAALSLFAVAAIAPFPWVVAGFSVRAWRLKHSPVERPDLWRSTTVCLCSTDVCPLR